MIARDHGALSLRQLKPRQWWKKSPVGYKTCSLTSLFVASALHLTLILALRAASWQQSSHCITLLKLPVLDTFPSHELTWIDTGLWCFQCPYIPVIFVLHPPFKAKKNENCNMNIYLDSGQSLLNITTSGIWQGVHLDTVLVKFEGRCHSYAVFGLLRSKRH